MIKFQQFYNQNKKQDWKYMMAIGITHFRNTEIHEYHN